MRGLSQGGSTGSWLKFEKVSGQQTLHYLVVVKVTAATVIQDGDLASQSISSQKEATMSKYKAQPTTQNKTKQNKIM